jgi:hypothetical protein
VFLEFETQQYKYLTTEKQKKGFSLDFYFQSDTLRLGRLKNDASLAALFPISIHDGLSICNKSTQYEEFSDPQCKYIALEYINRTLLMKHGVRRGISGGNKTNLAALWEQTEYNTHHRTA